jgi:hypothetical protein
VVVEVKALERQWIYENILGLLGMFVRVTQRGIEKKNEAMGGG